VRLQPRGLVEEREHGEDATVLGSVFVERELREEPADVGLDRLELYGEPLADGPVGPTLGHQREHLQLAGGELVEQSVSAHAVPALAGLRGRTEQGGGHRFFADPGVGFDCLVTPMSIRTPAI